MGLWDFIVAIVAISMVGGIITTAIRARFGYPITDSAGKAVEPGIGAPAQRQLERLTSENRELKQRLEQIEDRVPVLERIATDPAERTAREIDSLRMAPGY